MKNLLNRVVLKFQNHRIFQAKLVIAILALCIISIHGQAQIDLTKYYTPSFPYVNNHDFLEVDFSWNMAGNIQAHLSRAINSLDKHEIPDALAGLEEAIKLDSTIWINHYLKGVCNKQALHFRNAEIDFLTVVSLNPKLAEAHVELGELYISVGLMEQAKAHFNQAISKNPRIADSYLSLGNIAMIERDIIKAEGFYKKCLEINPNFAGAYLMQALVKAYEYPMKEKSIALFDRAVQIDSTFYTAYFWRGWTQLTRNKPDSCLLDWNKIIQRNPTNPFFVMMRGFLYIEIQDFDRAFIDVKNVVSASQNSLPLLGDERTVWDHETGFQVAANYLVAQGYGLNEEAFNYLKKSLCLLIAGKNYNALDAASLAEEKQPSASVNLLKAISLEKIGRFEEAIKYYDLTLSLDSDLHFAHKRKADIYFDKQQWDNSHAEVNQMQRLRPSDPLPHRYRGAIESMQGHHDLAIEHFDKFLLIDSTNFDVLFMRAICYERLNKRTNALGELLKISIEYPWNWQVHEKVVDNYLILGDTMMAIKFLDVHATNNPGKIHAGLKKLEILISMKKWSDANTQVDIIEATEIPSANIPKELSKLNLLKGLMAYNQHEYKKAIEFFDRSIDHDWNNKESIYYGAKCLIELKKFKDARYHLDQLRKTGYRDSEQLFYSVGGKPKKK